MYKRAEQTYDPNNNESAHKFFEEEKLIEKYRILHLSFYLRSPTVSIPPTNSYGNLPLSLLRMLRKIVQFNLMNFHLTFDEYSFVDYIESNTYFFALLCK